MIAQVAFAAKKPLIIPPATRDTGPLVVPALRPLFPETKKSTPVYTKRYIHKAFQQ